MLNPQQLERVERCKRIQATMLRCGYPAAAELFLERGVQYSPREFDRIEKGWLPRMRITSPS